MMHKRMYALDWQASVEEKLFCSFMGSCKKAHLRCSHKLELCHNSSAGSPASGPVDVGRQAKQGRRVRLWQGLNERGVVEGVGGAGDGEAGARQRPRPTAL